MKMVKVESSNVESIGYDEETQVLRVQFKGGGKPYDYTPVSREEYQSALSAASVGGYINANIKNVKSCVRAN